MSPPVADTPLDPAAVERIARAAEARIVAWLRSEWAPGFMGPRLYADAIERLDHLKARR